MAKGKLGLSRLQDSLTNTIDDNGTIVNGDANIANNLNKYFTNIGVNLTKNAPATFKYRSYLTNTLSISTSGQMTYSQNS